MLVFLVLLIVFILLFGSAAAYPQPLNRRIEMKNMAILSILAIALPTFSLSAEDECVFLKIEGGILADHLNETCKCLSIYEGSTKRLDCYDAASLKLIDQIYSAKLAAEWIAKQPGGIGILQEVLESKK